MNTNKQPSKNNQEKSNNDNPKKESNIGTKKVYIQHMDYQKRIQELEDRYKITEPSGFNGRYRMTTKPLSFSVAKRLDTTDDYDEKSQNEAPMSNMNTIELKRSALCPDKKTSTVYSLAPNQPRPTVLRS